MVLLPGEDKKPRGRGHGRSEGGDLVKRVYQVTLSRDFRDGTCDFLAVIVPGPFDHGSGSSACVSTLRYMS